MTAQRGMDDRAPDDRADLTSVVTYPLASRRHKVSVKQFGAPARASASFAEFVGSLPTVLATNDLIAVARAIVEAERGKRTIDWAAGGHVIKCGLTPVVIDLMRSGYVTSLALNGAGAVHDIEVALIGATSEYVEDGLADGTFGFAAETAELYAAALDRAVADAGSDFVNGLGELLGREIVESGARFAGDSVLATGWRLGLPVTVHVAIGTDIVHMHPAVNGAALGQSAMNDFRRYISAIRDLDGGVHLNVGSAVVLPEVFLKAVSALRNLGHLRGGFTSVNLDMIQHYRPLQNVVSRPTASHGAGYALTGHHELMVPLLAHLVLELASDRSQ
jgi:hypothetical protein